MDRHETTLDRAWRQPSTWAALRIRPSRRPAIIINGTKGHMFRHDRSVSPFASQGTGAKSAVCWRGQKLSTVNKMPSLQSKGGSRCFRCPCARRRLERPFRLLIGQVDLQWRGTGTPWRAPSAWIAGRSGSEDRPKPGAMDGGRRRRKRRVSRAKGPESSRCRSEYS